MMLLTVLLAAGLLAVLGVPIAISLGLSALVTMSIFLPHIPLEIVSQRIVNSIDKFPLVAVPLFILAGELMNTGGITDRLINLSKALVGWIRGGLGLVNVTASVFFAGISGSATADAAGIGRIIIPAMKKEGYDANFAVALTAASATLGPILPPSIVMIIYAAMTNISIGKLFLAGVVPGLVIAFLMMLLVIFYSMARGYPRSNWEGFINLFKVFVNSIGPLGAPAIIFLGVVGGYFGATEAGAIVVAYSTFLGVIYGELNWRKFLQACNQTATNVGVILFTISTASVIGWVLAVGRVPNDLATLIKGFGDNQITVMLAVVLILVLIGLFLDGLAAMVILVPVFVPITNAIGIDPIHFAMLVILCIMVGAITPPVGILLLVSCQVGNVAYQEVTKIIWVFVAPMIIVILACAFLPWLTLWLPNLILG